MKTRSIDMLDRHAFAAIERDFIDSQDFVQMSHDRRRSTKFVCHHNAYLVAGFLQRRGHEYIRWVRGIYLTHHSKKDIHHSWITLTIHGKTAAVFEFDPRQLYEGGGYDNDLMPSCYIPELDMTIAGTASIVDPELIELGKEESRWLVPSKVVIMRYVEDYSRPLDIDLADLDRVALEAEEDFKRSREDSDGAVDE